jgi:hypothetical protein
MSEPKHKRGRPIGLNPRLSLRLPQRTLADLQQDAERRGITLQELCRARLTGPERWESPIEVSRAQDGRGYVAELPDGRSYRHTDLRAAVERVLVSVVQAMAAGAVPEWVPAGAVIDLVSTLRDVPANFGPNARIFMEVRYAFR